ncbi:MAG: flagellin [Rhizomicrobium sp.]|jgi:flagellar hook-associated protein 3 FlgL
MTVERVATSTQAQYMLQQIMQSESNLNKTQAQVASGESASTYEGIGDQTAALQSAQSAAARTSGYQAATQSALNQVNLQDTQLTQLSNLANQLRQDVTEAAGQGDASGLMDQVGSLYSEVVGILNTQDSNGNYIYGGGNDSTPPVSATSLAQLGALGSSSEAFANGTTTTSVRTSDNTSVSVGMTASDIGSSLLSTIKSIVDSDNSSSFGATLSSAQSTFLTGAIQSATSAASDVNNVSAQNGENYTQLNDALTNQKSLSTMYAGFVSNIADVNMGQAVANLNQDQTALQAAMEVTSQLSQISLLNYLPASGVG